MATRKAELERMNRKISQVLGSKSWASSLNLIPVDDRAIQSFDSLLDYVKMLQDQIKGLENQISTLR